MRSGMGCPGADDPAYQHELQELGARCRDFLRALEADDFDACLLTSGMLTAQCAAVYKLSPPAGLIDVPAMFVREEPQ